MKALTTKLLKWMNQQFGPFNAKRLLFILCMLGGMIIPSIYALLLILIFPYYWNIAESQKDIDLLVMDYNYVSLLPAFFLIVEGINNTEITLNLFVIFFMYQIITSIVFYLMATCSWKLLGKYSGFFLGIALLLKVIPFMGITDWISPLQLSGVLFPGFGILGLVCLLFFISVLNNKKVVAGFILLSLIANLFFYFNQKTLPPQWTALQTAINDKNEYKLVLPQMVSSSSANYFLTPESAGSDIYKTKAHWLNLLPEDKFVFFEVNGIDPKTNLELNALSLFHNRQMKILYKQRQPMPIWMWAPFEKNNTPVHWFSNHRPFEFNHLKISAFICYESFLTWPYIFSLMFKPDLMMVSANLAHTDHSILKNYHLRNIEVWSRLFNVPALVSINSKAAGNK
jgi:hypothetical protein